MLLMRTRTRTAGGVDAGKQVIKDGNPFRREVGTSVLVQQGGMRTERHVCTCGKIFLHYHGCERQGTVIIKIKLNIFDTDHSAAWSDHRLATSIDSPLHRMYSCSTVDATVRAVLRRKR